MYEGFLSLRNSKSTSGEQKYCILVTNLLFVFDSQEDGQCMKGMCQAMEIIGVQELDLNSRRGSYGFQFMTNCEVFVFVTVANLVEKIYWMYQMRLGLQIYASNLGSESCGIFRFKK
jgi:hypothetical protein